MGGLGAGTAAAANFTGSVGGGSFATTAAAACGGDDGGGGGDEGASGSSGGLAVNILFFISLMSIPGAITAHCARSGVTNQREKKCNGKKKRSIICKKKFSRKNQIDMRGLSSSANHTKERAM
tara:strand:+ start:357 stop:725 length:369 start_codon:yes stop_codon:yes gene_type:complete